jgi:sulfite reductase alpha subunit-like flavoprotein
MFKQHARLYVCGDGQHMASTVGPAFVHQMYGSRN